ncbi:hypothetical protein [Streptomyces sp. NPDC018045]|uniref:hypothetical protein n=1 Tax=Streptomyces sp. NPDC018045 TaxID=3365037 RepID=UPI0037A399C7
MTMPPDPYTASDRILLEAVRDGIARLRQHEAHPEEPAAPLTAAEQWTRAFAEHLRDSPHSESDPMLLPDDQCTECAQLRALYRTGCQAEAMTLAAQHGAVHGPRPAALPVKAPADPDATADAETTPPA